MTFVENINSNDWGIRLTPKYDSTKMEFLDLMISQEENQFTTSTFFKPVDINSYLHFSSHHFKKWKCNIPFGQLRQIRKNCTSNSTFKEQALIIQERLLEKDYPRQLVRGIFEKTMKSTQREYLGLMEKSTTFAQTAETKTAKLTTFYEFHHYL